MRRYLLLSGIMLSLANTQACDRRGAEAPPTVVEPATDDKTSGYEAAKSSKVSADEAKPVEADAAEKAPETQPPAEAAPSPTPKPAAAPPANFVFKPSPTLADIPDKPLHGKVIGKAFDSATVSVKYDDSSWALEVAFADKQFFNVILAETAAPMKAGHTLQKERACCWGYLHHVPEGQSRATSLNAPNGFVVEVTGWDVRPYDEAGMMKQPAGTLKGRLAVAYDENNWVAGTFETTFEYFGPPPDVAQVIKARQAAEALAEVKAFEALPAPAGVEVKPGAKVWAAARQKDRWSFGEFTVDAVEGGVVMLKGEAVTALGLIREVPAATGLKTGMFANGVDHLGPQWMKVTAASGELFGVRYLNPAGQPRDNQIRPDRFVVRAKRADAPGLPPVVFFDAPPVGRGAGLAVANMPDGKVAVLVSTATKSAIEAMPEAALTYVDVEASLKRGQKVEAVVGCGMNSRIPREGTIAEVVEGGVGYRVDTDPCKGVMLSRERIRPL